MMRFLNFFTELEPVEINKIVEEEENINKLKILLANEATRILHGKDAAQKAQKTAEETFKSGGVGSDLPEIRIKSSLVKKGINILDFLIFRVFSFSPPQLLKRFLNYLHL